MMNCGSCRGKLYFTGGITKSVDGRYSYVYKCTGKSCDETYNLDEAQHDLNCPPKVDIPLTKFDVENRISKSLSVSTIFQPIPSTGRDYANKVARSEILGLLLDPEVQVYESGPVAQDMDHGLYIYFKTANAVGRLYVQTGEESRRTLEQLTVSKEEFSKKSSALFTELTSK
jgi:hypothetical protein